MKPLKWIDASLGIAARSHANVCSVLVLVTLMWPAIELQASNIHFWTGGSGSSSYWSAAANWNGSDKPNGSYEQLVFNFAGVRRQHTNDLLQTPPALVQELDLSDGGYSIYGNPLRVDVIVADYPAGTNCTIGFDLLAPLTVYVVHNNATLRLAGDIILTNGWFYVESAGDCIVSGAISGTYELMKESSGDLTLQGSAANTFTGPTYVKEGILRLNKTAVVPPGFVVGRVSVPGDLVIGSGTSGLISDIVWLGYHNQIADTSDVFIYASGQLDLNGYSDTIRALTMIGGSVVTGTGTLTLNGDVACKPAANVSGISGKLALGSGSARNFDVWPGAPMQVDAVVSGGSAIALVKANAGELILTAANTYDGPTVVAGGTLTVMHAQALGSLTNGTIVTGGTLKLLNTAVSGESLTVGGGTMEAEGAACAWNGDIGLGTNFVVNVNAGSALVFSNRISFVGGVGCTLIKGGPGQLTLAGPTANTHCYTWVRDDGKLVLSKTPGQNAVGSYLWVWGAPSSTATVRWMASDQIADTSSVNVLAPSLLDLNGFSETIGSLVGSGQVSLGAGRLTVSNEVGDCVFSGVITGSTGGLTKSGAATLTLSGTNKYSGTTAVSNGTLCVNGVISNSPVALYTSGSTLSGTGIVWSITVNQGLLRPGSSAGILTSLSTMTLNPGTLEIELNGTNVGTGYDQVRALTGVALGTTSSLSVTRNFASSPGTTFKIIDNASTKAVIGTFNGLPEGKAFAVSGLPFQISYVGGDGNDVVLTRVQSSSAVSNLVAHLIGSQVQLQAQGTAGLRYVIEATPHLNSPIPWQPIATNTADGTGLVVFTETAPSLYPQRFYRIASP